MGHSPIIYRGKLSEQLADHFIDLIVDGTFSPSQSLPTERELARQYTVSIGVVREAIKRLAAIGLVDVRHGVGTFVNPRDRWNTAAAIMLLVRSDPSSVIDMHNVRIPLELMAVEEAAKLASPSDLQVLNDALRRMGQSVDQPEAFVAADLDFHLALAKAARNRMLLPVLQPLIAPIHECMLRGARIPQAAPRAYMEHEQVASAVRAHKVRQARAAMQRHLETSRAELMSLMAPARALEGVVGHAGLREPPGSEDQLTEPVVL